MKISCLSGVLLAIGLAGQACAQNVPREDDRQNVQDDAYSTYIRCIRIYANRYVKTGAPIADIADASLSACQDRYQDLLTSTSNLLGGLPAAQVLLKDTVSTARNFAVRTVLEARFPLR